MFLNFVLIVAGESPVLLAEFYYKELMLGKWELN